MSRLFEFRPREGTPTLVAFGGGKGGIGKSLLSANFAAGLAQAGFHVLAVDLDLGDANLHTMAGVKDPATTLSDFISRRAPQLSELVLPTAIPNFSILPAARDDLDAPLMKAAQRDKLLRHLKKLSYDFILLDLGAGSGAHALEFFHAADVGVLVVTPERAAVENAYHFIKALIERQIKKVIPEDHANLRDRVKKGEPLSRLLLQETPDLPVELHEILRGLLAPLRLMVAANQVRRDSDQRLAHSMAACARKFFPIHLEPLGYVPYDPSVYDASADGQLLTHALPGAPAVQAVNGLARQFLRRQVEPPRDLMQEIGRPWAAQNPYVFLGLPPHATGGEIELAAKKLEAILAPESLAIHSLFPLAELQTLTGLIRRNREDLLSTSTRASLDQRLTEELAKMTPARSAAPARPAEPAPNGSEPAVHEAAHADHGEMPTPEAVHAAAHSAHHSASHSGAHPVGSVFSGRVLKATRELHGLTLDDVARETKIRRWYFECIEEENLAELPAPVYLKGFLRQYASILKLDGDKVVHDYMPRVTPPPAVK
jgi:flagellar biosynthesis protein FlhG